MMDRDMKDGKCNDPACFCRYADDVVHPLDAEGHQLPISREGQIEGQVQEILALEEMGLKQLLVKILLELRNIESKIPSFALMPVTIPGQSLADRELEALIHPENPRMFKTGGTFVYGECSMGIDVYPGEGFCIHRFWFEGDTDSFVLDDFLVDGESQIRNNLNPGKPLDAPCGAFLETTQPVVFRFDTAKKRVEVKLRNKSKFKASISITFDEAKYR